MYGFDGRTNVMVRGFGFVGVNEVSMGNQVASMIDGQWAWVIPDDFCSYEVNVVKTITGPTFDVVCSTNHQPITEKCEWDGKDNKTIKFANKNYNAELFVNLISDFLLGGQLDSNGITIIDPSERLMQSVDKMKLSHDLVGSYLDINLPEVVKWFFNLFGEGNDLRIPEMIKELSKPLLERIWTPFIGEVIPNKRLKADLSEIVIKSGLYPKWTENGLLCIVDNLDYDVDTEDSLRILRNIDTSSGFLLTERNGKVIWNQTREIV